MSETPRTQQLIDIANDEGISGAAVALVLQEHSEQLEREIAEANIEIEGLEEEIVALCDRLKRVNGGELGKQLADAQAEIERKDKLIEQMRDALNLMLEGAIHDFHYVCQHRDNCLCWGCQKVRVKAALSAAERGK
jgi:chromosome segregation ATPase